MEPTIYSSFIKVQLFRHLIEDANFVNALTEILKESGCHVIRSDVHHFDPQGVTATWILAESAADLHTYPEYDLFIFTIRTCSPVIDHKKIIDLLNARFEECKITQWDYQRYL